MFKTKLEKLMAFIVILALPTVGGMFVYRSYGDDLQSVFMRAETQLSECDTFIGLEKKSVEIRQDFELVSSELELDGSDSKQDIAIRAQVMAIFAKVGLKDKYGQIQTRDHNKTEKAFKVARIEITDIECTPQQFGALLFEIEKESGVIQIENCTIINQIDEVGRPLQRRKGVPAAGLLLVDLEISRLIEYRSGERPKK